MSSDQYPPQYPPPGPYGPPPLHPQGYPQAGPILPGHPQPDPMPPGYPQPGSVPPGYPQHFPPGYPHQQIPAPYGLPPAPFPAKRSRGPLIAGLAVLALLLVLGGGATAVNAYAKHTVCEAMEATGTRTDNGAVTTGRSTTEAIATMHDTADRMRTYGRMLIFDGALKSAVTGLADDVDELATLSTDLATDQLGTTALTRFFEVVNSVNTHARDAQRACGLPPNGIA